MLFITVTVVLGVLMYLFVQRVVVMKPVGIRGVDDAIDQLIERQRLRSEREARRKRRAKSSSWASTTLSEHTMEIIEALTVTTCPTEATSTAGAGASTAVSMGSKAPGSEAQTALEFDKTFSPPKEGGAAGVEKKAHRHHHKRHHRHRSREERERSSDSTEEGDAAGSEEGERGGRSKGGHKKHRRHRSRDAPAGPRLDAPLLVPGETLPGPDAVDVEMRSLEAVKTP